LQGENVRGLEFAVADAERKTAAIRKESRMKLRWITVPVAFSLACGASFPVPTQHMADAESAHRSALELGAASQPAAELHVKLAEEQMSKAKALISDGSNREADSLLIRSKADSELALALAREQGSSIEAQKATDQTNSTAITNAAQGAVK
jgi:hypothetical protein